MGKVKVNGSNARAGQPKREIQDRNPKQPSTDHGLSIEQRSLQQKCLNIFRDAFQPNSANLALLQEVKGHLFNRDFATAFSKPEYLSVYASRWSPSRALAYLAILQSHQSQLALQQSDDESPTGYRIICLGGGAGAEIVAFAAWQSVWPTNRSNQVLSMTMVDIADWDSIVKALSDRVVAPPEISKYATAAAKATNVAMLASDRISTDFVQQDILTWSDDGLKTCTQDANLLTIFFTLNELYSTSIPQTQNLLAQLTKAAKPNTFLLIVDSPGSYSTVSINGTEKRYPMQWLMDLALLGPPPKAGLVPKPPEWKQILSSDSAWFRLPSDLNYEIDLENMRYQIHLYQKLDDEG